MMRLIVPLVALSMGLAACSEDPAPRGAVARLDPQLAEAHHSYHFAGCTNSISQAEQRKLQKFLHDLWLTPDDVIIITLPKGKDTAADRQRYRTMAGLLAVAPAQKRFIGARDFRNDCSSTQSVGSIRVVRTLGVQADCSEGRLPNGCSSSQNLAAMVASPSDAFLPAVQTLGWGGARGKKMEVTE